MTLQTTASMAFFLLFVLIAVLNAFYLIMSVYTNKHYSRIPIVGLVFAILGFYFSPMYWHYWWLAIITDVGTLEFIIRGVPIIGRELWLHRRANIAYCFEGDDKAHNKHITFTLYRHGECHLKQEFKRAVGEVVAGMDVVDKIKVVKTRHLNGMDDVPAETVEILAIERMQ